MMYLGLDAERLEKEMQAHKRALIKEGEKIAKEILNRLRYGRISNIVIADDYVNLPLIYSIKDTPIFHSRLGCGMSRFCKR